MKTYKEFITELNKFEVAMRAGKLGLKSLKRAFASPQGGTFKYRKVSFPMANNLFKKMGLKKRKPPRYEVEMDSIMQLRKQNKPVPFGEKDKFSKLAVDKKSVHPPTADAARTKIDAMRNEILLKKNIKRDMQAQKLKYNFLGQSAKRKGKSKGMD